MRRRPTMRSILARGEESMLVSKAHLGTNALQGDGGRWDAMRCYRRESANLRAQRDELRLARHITSLHNAWWLRRQRSSCSQARADLPTARITMARRRVVHVGSGMKVDDAPAHTRVYPTLCACPPRSAELWHGKCNSSPWSKY